MLAVHDIVRQSGVLGLFNGFRLHFGLCCLSLSWAILTFYLSPERTTLLHAAQNQPMTTMRY